MNGINAITAAIEITEPWADIVEETRVRVEEFYQLAGDAWGHDEGCLFGEYGLVRPEPRAFSKRFLAFLSHASGASTGDRTIHGF